MEGKIFVPKDVIELAMLAQKLNTSKEEFKAFILQHKDKKKK